MDITFPTTRAGFRNQFDDIHNSLIVFEPEVRYPLALKVAACAIVIVIDMAQWRICLVSDDGIPYNTKIAQVDDEENGHLALDSTVEALTKLMIHWNKQTISNMIFEEKTIEDLKEVTTEQDLIPGILAVTLQNSDATPCIYISPERCSEADVAL